MDYGVVLPIILLIVSFVLTFLLAKAIRIVVLISRFQGPLALPIVGNAYAFKSGQRGNYDTTTNTEFLLKKLTVFKSLPN